MVATLPDTTPVLGRRTVLVSQTMATPGVLKLSELTLATNTFKATCFLYGGGLVTGEQNKGDAPKKLCEIVSREQLGSVKLAISDMEYSHAPQKALTDPANAARAAMPKGARVYVTLRQGVDDESPVAVDQYGDVYLVELGRQNKGQTGDDDFAEFSITQGGVIKGYWEDVKIIA